MSRHVYVCRARLPGGTLCGRLATAILCREEECEHDSYRPIGCCEYPDQSDIICVCPVHFGHLWWDGDDECDIIQGCQNCYVEDEDDDEVEDEDQCQDAGIGHADDAGTEDAEGEVEDQCQDDGI